MGIQMHVAEPNRLWMLNTPLVPDGIEDQKIRTRLIASHGIEIFGGFGPLAGKIFRIGLMGASSTQENVLLLLEALDGALRAEGYTPPGSGVAAAERSY
jgi:alanine-glyoxylate transaminase/serine-glyoxylate transaminase/serine-pyruvate transaminase